MKSLDRLKALVDPSAPDEWYVTDGATAVGPVGLELIERGLRAEKVPADAFVRHGSWAGWRDLTELAELDPSFDPRRTFRLLPVAKLPDEEEEIDDDSIEVIDPGPVRKEPLAFESASDLPEAMLILLASSVERCRAMGALVHRVQGDTASVACSHGPRMFEMLGKPLSPGDAVLSAAKQGRTILAEPVSGIAGHLLKKRLSRLGPQIESAFMVPVLEKGRLFAMLEVGRIEAYRGRDVAAAEELVEELVSTMTRAQWKREWRG